MYAHQGILRELYYRRMKAINNLSTSLHMITTIQKVLLPSSELLVMFLVSVINMETMLIYMTTKMTIQEDPVKINNKMKTKEVPVRL